MRPTFLEVNLTQLEKNISAIRAHAAPAKVMAMVKANAYGHGVDGVAPFLEASVDYFGVAIVEEGIHLRELGVRKPILVSGGILPEQVFSLAEYDLTLSGASIELLKAAEETSQRMGKRIKIHLKFDTGMERIGVHEYEAVPLIEQSLRLKHAEVEGIFTHFANSESADREYSNRQIERFHEILRIYEKLNEPCPALRHANNSGGILNLPEANFDMVRSGVLTYGVYPGDETPRIVDVKPALLWRSSVTYSKITKPGRPVSYGSLWQSEKETRVITVPCGYADGYFRRMSNRARVMIGGKMYPQVGRICMDQFMVDVGGDDVKVGEDVVLLGGGIAAEDLAEWAGTNAYEAMTNIGARVPRVFVRER
ncbi:MAG: alanine racemase [Anaerolineaceae bacterium]|nr:MAG: alanine racemase [Anaerolineaceae bacterium]HRQ32509.1 alanine racemase [Anaerolineales bacterium]